MKRLLTTTLLWLMLLTVASAQTYSLRVKEVDGTPNQPNVRTIVVSNGTLTCSGTTCTITTGGGGGTPGGSSTQLQYNNVGSFGGIGGLTYDPTAAWNLKLIPSASDKTGLVIAEPGSTPPNTVRGSDALLHIHVANGNTYWGIGYTNTAAGGTGWANYMADDATLFFTNTNLAFQFDNAGIKWFKASPTYYGTIGEIAGDTFALGTTLTTPAAMTPSLTWFNGGVKVTGYEDLVKQTAPSNPSSGNLRVFGNSSTNYVNCLDSGGNNCMPTLGIFTPVNDGAYSWVNQGSATVTTTGNLVVLRNPAEAGPSLHVRKKAVPATPYTIEIALTNPMAVADFMSQGFTWRESGSGKLVTCELFLQASIPLGGWDASKWNSATSFNASYFVTNLGGSAVRYLRATDDGANRTCAVSFDGITWLSQSAGTHTDFITPDEVGYFVKGQNASFDAIATFYHWRQF